jgi:hypothetical protein
MTRTAIALCLLVPACAADDGGGVTDPDPCGFASDLYLPYEVGMMWSYRVTDLSSGERKDKDQRLDDEIDDPVHGPVIVQITGKLAGSTRSLLRVAGDRVERLVQEDRDTSDAVERTTTYDPPQIRIDESADRVVAGARWEESYVETVEQPGTPTLMIANTDAWEAVAVDVACEAPLGGFECLHLRRTRTEGGIAIKDFYFARGIGKVREVGDNQSEELSACGR